ncbi:fatty acid desaturase family protein [Maricaulis sp. MIT060901]|uniref:fatty acid desaturase family protein n=1 Tax=Maricaulis sp. MIT060901 TaxID=3096993 RepID=UPI00399A36CF
MSGRNGNDLQLGDCLSREELRALSETTNWQGGLMLAGNLLTLALAFVPAILWPNPLTILMSVALIAGRQLAFAILLHDCAHNALFRSEVLNTLVGRWIGGAAVDVPLKLYRDYHLNHHKHAGTELDPDQGLVKDYPVTKESLRRKFVRDLTGQTGFKELALLWQNPTLAGKAPFIAFQIVLLSVLTLAGAPWAIALWWLARIFVYPVIMRVRNIGEHGVAADRYDTESRRNTHTTRPRWWERPFVAPNHVNFHLEHHMFAAVPPYNLPRLHRLLSERGYYAGYDCVTEGYGNMLHKAVRADGQTGCPPRAMVSGGACSTLLWTRNIQTAQQSRHADGEFTVIGPVII